MLISQDRRDSNIPSFALTTITNNPQRLDIKRVSRKMVEWSAEQEGTRAWATDKRASISVYMRCMLAYQRGIGSAESPYLVICNLNNFPRRASGRRGGYLPASFCPGNEMRWWWLRRSLPPLARYTCADKGGGEMPRRRLRPEGSTPDT